MPSPAERGRADPLKALPGMHMPAHHLACPCSARRQEPKFRQPKKWGVCPVSLQSMGKSCQAVSQRYFPFFSPLLAQSVWQLYPSVSSAAPCVTHSEGKIMGTALAALNTSHSRPEAQKISGDFFSCWKSWFGRHCQLILISANCFRPNKATQPKPILKKHRNI